MKITKTIYLFDNRRAIGVSGHLFRVPLSMKLFLNLALCAVLALVPVACARQEAVDPSVSAADDEPEPGGLTRNQKIAAGTAVGVVGVGVIGFFILTAVAAAAALSGKGG